MFTFFITLALGYLAREINMMDDEFDAKLSSIIINITCPAVVLDSVLSNTNLPSQEVVLQIFGVSFILFAVMVVVSLIISMLYRCPKNQRGAHAFTICFSNVGLIGFPVCDAVLGSDSVLYVAVFNIVSSLVIYSVGVWMIARSGTITPSRKEQMDFIRKSLLSPMMAACVLALFLAIFRVTDMGVIGKTCELVGAMTPAAAMFVIGSALAKYDIRSMLTNVWAYATTLARLIVIPAVTYFVGSFFIADSYLVASLTLACAMPAAMIGTPLSLMYGGDQKLISQGMFLTTVFSLVTIPLVTMLIL